MPQAFTRSSELLQDSRPFLLPLLLGSPELVTVLHNIPQHRPTDEHQVFPPRRVLDVELKLLEPVRVALKDVLEVPEEEVCLFVFLWVQCYSRI